VLVCLVAEIEAASGRALAVTADVADPAQAERLIKTAHDTYSQIDLLVNNAGTNIRAPIHEVTDEQWQEILGANLNGTFYCTRAVAPLMMARRQGKIVNIASLSSLRATPRRAAYTAAKFGARGFSQAVAIDLKDYGVTVSTVLPGPIRTALRARSAPDEDPSTITPAEEVAEVVLFLATRPRDVIIPEIAIFPRVAIS
jgi:3-oxoacyl-[acyl-carrier protein] reductase